MTVSIIVINYNTQNLTANCLKSIIEKTNSIEFEIILVDNGSTDGSKDAFAKRNDIVFISLENNVGFGAANNIGVKKAKGEFVFLLNSDTILVENSILQLHQFYINKQPTIKLGVLGCLLSWPNGNVNGFGGNFPKPKIEILLNLRKLPIIGKYICKTKHVDFEPTEPYFEVDYVIGADMFLKKETFLELGGFDPLFFMYYEESDLQFNMRNRGYRNYVITTTKIIHLEEGTSKQNNSSNRKRIMMHKSRIHYLKKNFPNQYKVFQLVDNFFLVLNKFNSNYSNTENQEYIKSIKKIY